MIDLGEGMMIFALVRLTISFINWLSQLILVNRKTTDAAEVSELSDPSDISHLSHPSHHSHPFAAAPAASVSVLVPARNEQDNIANLLRDLLAFPAQPREIIIYDDLSTDNTAHIVRLFASHHPHIKLLQGTPPPAGWLGKNYACHQLAAAAKGEKLLFLDADVRVKPGLIENTTRYMDRHNLKLLSIFPVQDMPDAGTSLAVPLMNWILLSLLPLPLVRLSRLPAFSAANGQFMLFHAATYQQTLPHLHCKANRVEDIAIIKEYKRRKLPVATLASTGDIHCTMYHTLPEAIDGFSKNVFQFFGGSLLLTYGFALVTTIAPILLFLLNSPAMALLYLLIVLLIRVFVSLTSRQSIAGNILLLLPQQYIFWKIIITATIKRKQKKLVWKDRNISTVQ